MEAHACLLMLRPRGYACLLSESEALNFVLANELTVNTASILVTMET